MKKIYLLSFASLVAYGSLAQSIQHAPLRGVPAENVPAKKIYRGESQSNRAMQTFVIDYEVSDQSYQLNNFGYDGYFRFITDFNYNYASTDTVSKYPIVAFRYMNDSYGLINGLGEPTDATIAPGTSITIDSVFMFLGHENNSGTAGNVDVNIIGLNSSGYPTSTILNTQSFSAPVTGLNPANNQYNFPIVKGIAVGYTLPVGTNKFGVRIDYTGNTMDTMGIMYGAVASTDPCLTLTYTDAGGSPVPGTPVESHYARNSYQFINGYNLTIPTSATGGSHTGDYYFDCDGSGGPTAGDGFSMYQNMGIWVKITANATVVGVNEQKNPITRIEQNYPNPFSTNSVVNYALANATNVTFTVTDMAGKVVMSENYGQQGAGAHSININGNNLESGIYYYTLTAGTSKETRKMTVVK